MGPKKPLCILHTTPAPSCVLKTGHGKWSCPAHATLHHACGIPDGDLRMQSIPYEELMQQLGIANIRELEDLLITDCFHQGIITGRLDQRQKCVEVLDSIGRDVRASELQPIIDSLQKW